MSTPDIDPYGVLGVANDATIAEIRAAHRKRVLKCHPDKIQDVSQRNAAQDEFQKVQQAYELLSDDTRRKKHDEKVKIAELKRKLAEARRTDSAYNSSRPGTNNREYRNGYIVEERVPMEVYFEEAMRFTEEPRSMSRKFEEMGTRKPKSTPTEEKKKTRTPMSSGVRAAKEQRETTKATHSDRAKTRDQERRRQTEAKFETNHLDSDDDISDPSPPIYRYERRQSSTPRRDREERQSRSRPSEFSHRRERRFDDESDLSDSWKAKLDDKTLDAEKYIGRSSKSPRAFRGYDSTEPESSGSRSERRPPRRSESRNDPYENMSTPRTHEVKPPKMPSATTSPGIKGSLRPFLGARSQTTSTGYVRAKTDSRESRDSRKARDSTLYDMAHEAMPPRTSKMRERTDSGYSSPNTPELPRGTSPKTSQRYSIHEAPDFRVVEPKAQHYRPTRSPERAERERERSTPTRSTPKRSTTYQSYDSPRVERERPSRTSTSRTYGVQYITRPEESGIRFARVYDADDVTYSRRYEDEYKRYTPDRRQSVR
ncbi:hypothetical protein N7541_001993 [Penicillium brevicompactum]|uniref:J domain-containing protein n=1 Tax=Penicillium brevicompactum TaxID=5074 RepID=A0A9W9UYD7_PENBR|nr:hypothetical protein N7541_001993 [Penicillium brevicompactum]